MEHWSGNQYETNNVGILYDIECMLLYVDLSEFCNHTFGTDIRPNERVVEIVKKLRGKKVYGNIQYPDRFYVKKREYNGTYELMYQYHYADVGNCYATYGEKTEEEFVGIVKELHSYLSANDIFNNSFKELMGYYDMKYICNAEEVALRILKYYHEHITNVKEGVDVFKKMTGKDLEF